ncbi:MAG: zinc-finger domain-containing protein [Burkholderiales bacterium]
MDPVKSVGKERQAEVTAAELPLHCPLPSQQLWNSHPRVFLPIEKTGEALCPYCGTRYVLRGAAPAPEPPLR